MLKKDTKIAHRLQNINTTLLKYTGKHHNGKHKLLMWWNYGYIHDAVAQLNCIVILSFCKSLILL